MSRTKLFSLLLIVTFFTANLQIPCFAMDNYTDFSSLRLESLVPLYISILPSNISSAGEFASVIWTPFDFYSSLADLTISKGSNILFNTLVDDIGVYVLALDLAPGLYNVTIIDNIGSVSAEFTVYSSIGLNVASPNVNSLLYTNTTDAPFTWSPFDPSTGNVTITLTDLNTNQTFNVTVPNTGSASVNISALDLPPSSYQATIDSALGSGSSPDFVIEDSFTLTAALQSDFTKIPNAERATFTWPPRSPSGPNTNSL